LLAGAGSQSRVIVWDVQSGRQVLEFTKTDPEPSVAFSPDGKLLAAAMHDGAVCLWAIPSGKMVGTLRGHIQAIRGIAFSPDGKTLATGGDDRKVKLWNIGTQHEVATLELLKGGCRSVRFSPDGRTLAAGHILGAEVEIWLWQVPSLKEIDAGRAGRSAENKQLWTSVLDEPDRRDG
jgi:WD40 repeat protein